jgi:hypothetical protein
MKSVYRFGGVPVATTRVVKELTKPTRGSMNNAMEFYFTFEHKKNLVLFPDT